MHTRWFAMPLVLLLAGCGAFDSLTSGFEHADAVETDVEAAVGVRPKVGFKWVNGSLDHVTVMFEGVPADLDLQRAAEAAEHAVAEHFEQSPDRIVLMFALEN